jgi:transaldolase
MARIFSGKTMPPDGGDCEEVLARYETAGVDLDALANDLQRQLSAGHMSKWIELLDTVAYKSAALTTKPRYVKNRR